ncbi:MAG: NAD(+) synthase, partial [Bacteroidaceae bacterium]|nr:NAD(+) synthase [Bacteroidaceae bacterium]
MQYGFVKVASAVPVVRIGDCNWNTLQIESLIVRAEGKGVEIICFPELSITGYSCADLFHQQQLIDSCENSLFRLLDITRSLNIVAIVGMPLRAGNLLFNVATVIHHGKILGIVPKSYIPNYKEFYEKRWFTSGINIDTVTTLCAQQVRLCRNQIFTTSSCSFGIEICEDLWAPIPPSSTLALQGADIIFNLSATNEVVSKHTYLSQLLSQQSARCISGYVYTSSGFGESSTDLVFTGNGMIYENGHLLSEGKRFEMTEQLIMSEIDIEYLRNTRQTNITFADSALSVPAANFVSIDDTATAPQHTSQLTRTIDPRPFVPSGPKLDARCEEIFAIQVAGLARRVSQINAKTLVVGISGGLDSTLALLVCAKTIDELSRSRKDIVAITMPGFGTTDRTYNNAMSLMQSLGVTIREISIREACIQHFSDIGHDINVHDVTYENSQARERTQILMDVANETGGIVVGTGDLSELALGWATYNGDHMSNYGVNASIPKTLVRHLVSWVAQTSVDESSRTTLLDIVDTPI